MTYKQGTISLACRRAGYDMRAKIFWSLIVAFIALVSIQIMAIGSTTKNVAERHYLEKEILDTTARAGELEFNYIELRNSIGIEMAEDFGLREIKTPAYISRVSPDSLGTLTFNR